MKNVMIKIKGTQGLGDDAQVIEFSTEGTLKTEDEAFILAYTDAAVAESARVDTVLTAKNNCVTLERSGALNSKLIIEKGVRSSCFYSVPEGSLTLGIYGKEVDLKLNGSGGRIKMVYTLDADMRPISENAVEINITER